MDRRAFLAGATAIGASQLIPQIGHATDNDFWIRDRELWVRRDRPGRELEEFRVVYWSGGRFDPNNYVRLCYLFRDSKEDVVAEIDPRLFNLLFGLQRWVQLVTGRLLPIDLTSGFRTPQHNASLIKEGASPTSEHLNGRAADIKIPSVAPAAVVSMARFFEMGGVGIYNSFTHVDVGRVHAFVGRRPRR
ncbi:DUF882 domain-containing protein [Burkholderia sp. Tr-20390]|uniref:YcbK family protein n=1 Tax=Burkholderia sp. Tr-20390 TaxID=2703904 RepID=UPI00197EF60E|nr:DUF882 domain-containing protein [Burkholderia sp. Tr-20390]MBN3729352.1 DUF882 domain-containing protein [Burkholderia sp. Tr-20390]